MAVEHFTIPARPHPIAGRGVLDPVDVYLHDLAPRVGRLVLVQWGRAWSCTWSAMGHQPDGTDSTVAQFLAGADADYVAGKLTLLPGQLTAKQLRHDENHLVILCMLLRDHLRATTKGAA